MVWTFKPSVELSNFQYLFWRQASVTFSGDLKRSFKGSTHYMVPQGKYFQSRSIFFSTLADSTPRFLGVEVHPSENWGQADGHLFFTKAQFFQAIITTWVQKKKTRRKRLIFTFLKKSRIYKQKKPWPWMQLQAKCPFINNASNHSSPYKSALLLCSPGKDGNKWKGKKKKKSKGKLMPGAISPPSKRRLILEHAHDLAACLRGLKSSDLPVGKVSFLSFS